MLQIWEKCLMEHNRYLTTINALLMQRFLQMRIGLMIGLYLLCIHSLYQEELQTAVDLWVEDNATALETYGEINVWDVSFITDMSSLFYDKASFNSSINNWDVSSVTSMNRMFSGAVSFYGDISSWNVSSVTSMGDMFSYHLNFNQDLSSWDISSVEEMNDMFLNTPSLSRRKQMLYP